MKKMILSTGLLIFVTTAAFAQEHLQKTYPQKSFAVNAKTVFKIKNIYGKVHIENTDDNSLIINTVVNFKNRSRKKSETLFKSVKILVEQKGNIITAETQITKNLDKTNPSIDYHIRMPKSLRIELENKYGDIFIDKLHSASFICCKYGNLQINEWLTEDIEKPAKLTLKYSKGTLDKSDYLDAKIKYSDLNLNTSKVVYLESSYSKIRCKEVHTLKSLSKYDSVFKIKTARKINLEGMYGTFDIRNLDVGIKADIKYSSLDIENTAKDFQSIDVQGKYSDIYIEPSSESSFWQEIEKSNYGSQSQYRKKFVGNNQQSKSIIKASVSYGNLKIKKQ